MLARGYTPAVQAWVHRVSYMQHSAYSCTSAVAQWLQLRMVVSYSYRCNGIMLQLPMLQLPIARVCCSRASVGKSLRTGILWSVLCHLCFARPQNARFTLITSHRVHDLPI